MRQFTVDVILSKQRWEQLHKKETLDRIIEEDLTINSYWQFLRRYEKHWKHGAFLDLGCGVAWVASLLAKQGVRIFGIDITREAIIKSRKLFRKRKVYGKFLQGNLLQLPFKDNYFNFIWSCMSFEYVSDIQKAIKEANRVLKIGGVMVAIVPVVSLTTLTYHQLRGDIPNIFLIKPIMEWFHLKLMQAKYMHYGYEQSFTVKKLKKLFESAAFRAIKIDFFETNYPLLFLPKVMRPFCQRILKHRLFWPLVYVEATK